MMRAGRIDSREDQLGRLRSAADGPAVGPPRRSESTRGRARGAAPGPPRTRKKSETKGAPARQQPPARPAMSPQPRTDLARKPQGAFSHLHKSAQLLPPAALLVALALCMIVAECGARATGDAAESSPGKSLRLNRIEMETNPAPDFDAGPGNGRELAASSYHRRRRLAAKLEHERQQRVQQQNQLKYLIAKTSSLPQLVIRGRLERARQSQRRADNSIDDSSSNDNKEKNLPSSVPSFRSQSLAVSSATGRRLPRDRHALNNDITDSHARAGPQFADGLDVADFDDGEDFDDEDLDDAAGGSADEGAAEEDDEEDAEGDAEDEEEDEGDAGDLVGDSALYNDELNAIPLDEPSTNKKGSNTNLSRWRPGARDGRLGADRERPSEERPSSGDGRPLPRPFWKGHHKEAGAFAGPSEMFTTPDPLQLLELSRRARHQHHSHRQKPPPAAPYQSPVVVSISDNSFVSASPVGAAASEAGSQPGSVHYSHIVAGPKNELPSYGRRYWHDSHLASIHMVQEEPNELHQGGINSAIIAILFGIGVTGTLIMIVSIKMRSIRERVAYKGRRRSLVPDTDFLINTIPM